MSSDSEGSPSELLLDDAENPERDSSKLDKVKPKRRTKTGCLTCRKRRIKCGEERPVCKNCVKSKRECAGYNPPPTSVKSIDPVPSLDSHGNHNYYPVQPYLQQNYVRPSFPPSLGVPYVQGPDLHGMSDTMQSHSGIDMSGTRVHPYPSGHAQTSAMPFQGSWLGGNVGLMGTHPFTTQSAGTMSATFSSDGADSAISSQQMSAIGPAPTFHRNYLQNMDGQRSMYPAFASGSQMTVPWHFPSQHHTLKSQQDVYESSASIGVQAYGFTTHDSTLEDSIGPLRKAYPSSPLLDENCHGIFRHFLDVTAPCMSIFDRLEHAEVPAMQTMVWTSGLPKMALQHPALAHAILAIGAIHLFRLDRLSDDIAIEHFTCALQKVKVLLESKTTRSHVATLATILLLAYYEVITGDHARWSLHISGAARLVMENDFSNTIRKIKSMRKQAQHHVTIKSLQTPHTSHQELIQMVQIPANLLDEQDWNVNQDLVSRFMGMVVDYDTQLQPGFSEENNIADLTKKSAEEFKILMEMYWWYCKQDLFQSMLSGDAPMLPYAKWKYCPPRGQFGLVDKPHASVDHLWLIIARIMDFGVRDRKRKLRVIGANGGAYLPPPDFLPESQEQHSCDANIQNQPRPTHPPVANESRTRTSRASSSATRAPPGLPMYGMLPPPAAPVRMSSSFEAMSAEIQKATIVSPAESTNSSDGSDLDFGLQDALKEYSSLSESLETFRSALPSGFEPISSKISPETPFGPARIYGSPTIATMWTFYHVAKIILRRMHPHSHPAAMISVGINAQITAEDAQIIGNIFAGLLAQYEKLSMTGCMDHLITAALVESSFSLLFAGVQYQAPLQRTWTVSKLQYLAQKTGWASCTSIASACEASWHKMGEAGKGPPYVRTLLNPQNHDVRLTGAGSTNNPLDSDSLHDSGVVQEHESRFVRHDRNLIDRHTSTRAYWALGLLSVEDDLKLMNINDDA